LWKKKNQSCLRSCISCEYEWFSQAHNHEHDNGNHSDHNESTAHTRVAPTAKLDSLLNKFKVKKSMLQNLVVWLYKMPVVEWNRLILFRQSYWERWVMPMSTRDELWSGFPIYVAICSIWIEIPLIYLRSGNDSIRKLIGVDVEAKTAPFIAFFWWKNYKLSPYLDAAYKAANPNQFEKDFIETDKNLMESALSGRIWRFSYS
jgi:hypothetical protein